MTAFEVETPIGPAQIVIHNRNSLIVLSVDNLTWVINRVAYNSGSIRFGYYDGEWSLMKNESGFTGHAIYLRRTDMGEPSWAARNKAAEVITNFVNGWIKEHPDATNLAQKEFLEQKLKAAETQVEEAVNNLRKAEETRNHARKELDVEIERQS